MAEYERYAFKPSRVVRKTKEGIKTYSLHLEAKGVEEAEPGQFFMVWLPGFEEVPISASGQDGEVIRLSVAVVGPTTKALSEVAEGTRVMLKGPIGRGFTLGRRGLYALLAGGYGAAPLIFCAKRLRELGNEVIFMAGARTAGELLFVDEAREMGLRTYLSTEDGSAGAKGLATELLERAIDEYNVGFVLTCGPEPMMYKAMRICMDHGVPFEASLERYMRCGMGVCGSCVLDPVGLRVCVDGPVFDSSTLSKTDFGRRRRSPTGEVVEVS